LEDSVTALPTLRSRRGHAARETALHLLPRAAPVVPADECLTSGPAPTSAPTLLRAASLGELLVAMQSEVEAVREAAWAACYGQFYEVVWAHASRVLRSITWLAEPREVAADVASDVFLALPTAVRHYREEGRAGWWLKQITVRTALRKKEALTGRWVSGRTAGKPATAGGRQHVSFDETSDRVGARLDAAELEELLELGRRREALRASSDAQLRRWDAFLDLYVAGYEFAEIGARLGLTAGTARNWLCQIRKHLARPSVAA
jgi:RNA polymerase sigma factor (sigma-70 family)